MLRLPPFTSEVLECGGASEQAHFEVEATL